jgi:integrase
MEALARRVSPKDDDRRRDILRVIQDAGRMALHGTLNMSSGQALLNRIAEAATGESLRQETIEGWLRSWLREKTGSRSGGTSVRYKGVVDSFLDSLPAAKRGMPLSTLGITEIQKFRDSLLDGGRTATTANLAVKVLRAPLNLAKRQGLIQSNPAEAVEMMTSDEGEKAVFAPAEIAALVRIAGPEWKGLILAGYYTGGRLGDLAKLKWSAVDLEGMTIMLTPQKTKRFKQCIQIPIHAELGRWLTEAVSRKGTKTDVFPSLCGKAAGGATGLSCQFKRLIENAGIVSRIIARKGEKGRSRSSHSFHSLRHSFNSAMANVGVSQELRQILTGQASKAVNDRYTHTQLETLRKAVESVPLIPGGP